MSVNRLLVNLVCDDLSTVAAFYETLLGFERLYDSDWFIDLKHPGQPIEIGIIRRGHDIVPESASGPPGGFYLTFVVADVEEVASAAISLGAQIVEEPKDTEYGQRRMVLLDPAGNTLDISSPYGNG